MTDEVPPPPEDDHGDSDAGDQDTAEIEMESLGEDGAHLETTTEEVEDGSPATSVPDTPPSPDEDGEDEAVDERAASLRDAVVDDDRDARKQLEERLQQLKDEEEELKEFMKRLTQLESKVDRMEHQRSGGGTDADGTAGVPEDRIRSIVQDELANHEQLSGADGGVDRSELEELREELETRIDSQSSQIVSEVEDEILEDRSRISEELEDTEEQLQHELTARLNRLEDELEETQERLHDQLRDTRESLVERFERQQLQLRKHVEEELRGIEEYLDEADGTEALDRAEDLEERFEQLRQVLIEDQLDMEKDIESAEEAYRETIQEIDDLQERVTQLSHAVVTALEEISEVREQDDG